MALKRSTKISKKPYKKRAGKRTKGVGLAVKQYVKRIVSKEIENKSWMNYSVNNAINTVSAGATPAYIPLQLQISQGLGKSQRIGNEVKVKRALLTGFVNLLPYNIITNPNGAPVTLKMWICSSKVVNDISLPGTNIGLNFFDVVNSSIGFQGNMLDMLFAPNKELWKIHATKTIKLGLATNNNGVADNGSFSQRFSFQVGKHLGTLKYNDGATQPTNRSLFCVFQAVYPDGSSTSVQAAEYHYNYIVDYEDA